MNHHTAPVYLLAFMAIGLALTGCDAITKPYPDRAMYAVTVDVPQDNRPGEGRGVLKITRVRVVSPYDDRMFYYKVGPNEYKSDYYNTFVTAPDRMFTVQLQAYLRGAGGFDMYLPPFSGADSDLRLEGSITLLYADFTEGPNPYAVVEGRFFLVGLDHSDDVVFTQKTYHQRVQAQSPKPEAIIQAWSEGLTALYAELAADLIEVVEPGRYEKKPKPVQGEQEPGVQGD
jgi:cholesterol transport system auxiliary component